MELFIQFAHGMLEISKSLTRKWANSTIILSPRDLEPLQIAKNAPALNSLGANLLFDPQCYAPRANHHRLTQYSYWISDYSTHNFGPETVRTQLKDLYENHNLAYGTKAFIIPGQYITDVDDIYFRLTDLSMNELSAINISMPKLLTVCISSNSLRDESQIHNLLEYIESLPVDGVYLVAEPIAGKYLVEDPVWLKNLMEISAAIKLDGKSLIIGYANHQHQILALTKADAIASGNFLNSRSFSNSKFFTRDEETSRRSVWYYCPQSLSEYKITSLDMAQSVGLLDHLRADPVLGSNYADILFAGAQPSSVEFKEPNPFYHYLQCLRGQIQQIPSNDYDSVKRTLLLRYETATELTELFRSRGIRGGNRDYSNVLDATFAALTVFDSTWGLRMRTQWNAI